jgi:hypothetical protein
MLPPFKASSINCGSGPIGEAAAPALRSVLNDKSSLEVRKRIEWILERERGQDRTADHLRAGRALQVLETIGTPQARRVLEGLTRGADEAMLTQDAKAAVQRLSRWPTEKP